jgi:hypothetical protein
MKILMVLFTQICLRFVSCIDLEFELGAISLSSNSTR